MGVLPIEPQSQKKKKSSRRPSSSQATLDMSAPVSAPLHTSMKRTMRSPTSQLLPDAQPAIKSTRIRGKRASDPDSALRLQHDRLGTLVRRSVELLDRADSWEDFVHKYRGESYLSPKLHEVDHPAAALLTQWRDEGVPAESTSEPWSLQQKDECVQRGCHISAKLHSDFIREEMVGFIEDGFWTVLPYSIVRGYEELQIWPGAIKEERDRKPRLLCDHSWNWGWPSINETTIAHAPPEAMQFGGALPRILYDVRHANPRFGPPRLAKYDLENGFYKLFLRARDCLRLALLLPPYEDEEPLVAIPMSCTMGWVQSPPTFCTMSETACDAANRRF